MARSLPIPVPSIVYYWFVDGPASRQGETSHHGMTRQSNAPVPLVSDLRMTVVRISLPRTSHRIPLIVGNLYNLLKALSPYVRPLRANSNSTTLSAPKTTIDHHDSSQPTLSHTNHTTSSAMGSIKEFLLTWLAKLDAHAFAHADARGRDRQVRAVRNQHLFRLLEANS